MLVLAGYETTGNALGFTLYLLAAHPPAQQRLVAEVRKFGLHRRPSYESLQELPFVEACLKEALRLYPPAPTHIRWGAYNTCKSPNWGALSLPSIKQAVACQLGRCSAVPQPGQFWLLCPARAGVHAQIFSDIRLPQCADNPYG